MAIQASSRDLDSAVASDMTNIVKDVTVDSRDTDGVSFQKETTWQNSKWPEYFGYFMAIPELHSACIMKAIWDVGKGYTADPETTVILDHISGWGKESFRDVLFNMDITKNIAGDSFAEIIRADDGTLLNLKPLNPGTIKIVVDSKGRILRYEQTKPWWKIFTTPKKYAPEKIFHLCNNRVADQIHGISRVEPLIETIKAMNEGFVDTKKVMHYQGRPYIIWFLKTDDTTKINAYKRKVDAARNLGEDIYVPDDDDTVRHEVVVVNPSLFILEWHRSLTNRFYRAFGLPLVLFGQAGQTESGGKIEYTGHEQVWENDQRYIEEAVWNQLYLRIDLNSPISLLQSMQTDQAKDANQGMEIQPNDLQAGKGR